MKNIYLLLIIFSVTKIATAQIDSVQRLKEVLIFDHKMNVSERNAKETEGAVIFAGKKNEIIDLTKPNISTVNNDARQIFAQVPGISVWEADGSGLQINVATRGLSANRSWEFNTRQNGYDISSDPNGYPEAYYNPPMEAIEKIVLMRGGSSLQYGSQFGGLLDYKMITAPKDKKIQYLGKQTAGGYGLFNSFNMLSGTAKNISYSAFYNFKRADGWRKNNKHNAHNAFANIGVQINDFWKLEAEYTYSNYIAQQPGGLTDSLYKIDAQQSLRSRNYFNVIWNMPALKLTFNKNKYFFNLTLFGLLGNRSSIGFTKAINIPDTIIASTMQYSNRQLDKDEYKNFGTEARFKYDYKIKNWQQTLSVGARFFLGNTFRQQQGKGDAGIGFNLTLNDSIFPKQFTYQTMNGALFAENIFRFGKLAIIPGVRLEILQNTANGYYSLDANHQPIMMQQQKAFRVFPLAGLALEYHINKVGEIYGNITQAYRPVLFSELTPAATSDSIDQHLKDAKGFTSDLGIRGKIKNYFEYDLSGYYLIYNNKIGTIAQTNSLGQIYQFKTNLGQSHHRGFEGFLKLNLFAIFNKEKTLGDLELFASLAYNNAIYTKLKTTKVVNGTIETTELKNNRVEYAPRFINRFGLNYHYRFFTIGTLINWVDGVYTDAANTKEANSIATVGYLPSYWVMDASISFDILKDKITAKASVTNLFNNKYATRRSGGYPGPGILPADGRNFNISLVTKF